MMWWIIKSSHGYPLKNLEILLPSKNSCIACSQGKLITKPSSSKVVIESLFFHKRIQGDIYCSYFIILIDASSKWSHVCLLSSQNVAFAILIAHIIILWV